MASAGSIFWLRIRKKRPPWPGMAVLHRRLRQGVERFDPQRGIRFDTFSYWWIRQGILHSLAA